MAEQTPDTAASPPASQGWQARLAGLRRPGPGQFAALAALAAMIALGVALWLWAGSSGYSVLYRGLPEAEAGLIMEALDQNNIPYRVDPTSGALLVPDDQVHPARLKLAAQGLPKGVAGQGFELLDEHSGFGTSQFMENARYQRALEGELARSVMSVDSVANARVHLAIPKETVFVRDRQPPTASVLVELHPGRVLDPGQVAAIVHLVSSSVPKLSRDQVSVVDQRGNLLTRPDRNAALALSLDQMDYKRRLEEDYIRKIENLLQPVVGQGRVRAQVALELDFTVTEQTAERYEAPEDPLIRSQRRLSEVNSRPRPGGIPGALTNQPPGAAEVPEELPEDAPQPTDAQLAADGGRPERSREEITRNNELDKIISHTRNQPGRLLRLSTAVVLDHKLVPNEEGILTPTPLSEAELASAEALVRQAVGFSEQRGDTVDVINVAFAAS
ncbi:MAG: flagellar basal-body MS-ring/collar protein FliF, partial [Candidatus Competibacteraceae bacterium]|nr:flagellar basal-body MS-ring/collar protein FliF [Candidatus Competibacteraceae bacterium]